MMKINPGDTIVGISGKKMIVDRVEGDSIYSGTRKVSKSAVLEVIPPKKTIQEFLKVGDRVYIPVCNKFGTIEWIFHKEGKNGLFARVNRVDGITRDILIECLEVA